MIVKKADNEDLDFIYNLSKSRVDKNAKKDEFERLLKDENLLFLILKENEENIGYLSFRLEIDECEIDEIAILEKFEHQNKAYEFLKQAKESLKNQGYKKIFLEVRKSNVKAIKLYERSEFKSYAIRKNYYGDEDAVLYVCEVK